jgi:hypothetical protein
MLRITRLAIVATLVLGGLASGATGVLAAPPEHERSGRFIDTFADDFILDLCGIETMTTVTEQWTLTTYADGSQRFRTSRTYVSEDPRLPIEYGAGMASFDVDGVQTVNGSLLRLRRPGGGVFLLAAGHAIFSDEPTIRGPYPFPDIELADYYCP